MTFGQAIKTCFMKYSDFSGRASRSEYWWFILFVALAAAVLGALSPRVSLAFHVAMILPMLSAGARRLHDTNLSGWLQLLCLVPVAGWLVVVILMAREAREPNRY